MFKGTNADFCFVFVPLPTNKLIDSERNRLCGAISFVKYFDAISFKDLYVTTATLNLIRYYIGRERSP